MCIVHKKQLVLRLPPDNGDRADWLTVVTKPARLGYSASAVDLRAYFEPVCGAGRTISGELQIDRRKTANRLAGQIKTNHLPRLDPSIYQFIESNQSGQSVREQWKWLLVDKQCSEVHLRNTKCSGIKYRIVNNIETMAPVFDKVRPRFCCYHFAVFHFKSIVVNVVQFWILKCCVTAQVSSEWLILLVVLWHVEYLLSRDSW